MYMTDLEIRRFAIEELMQANAQNHSAGFTKAQYETMQDELRSNGSSPKITSETSLAGKEKG